MARRIFLPEPNAQEPYLRRLVAELTQRLTDQEQRITDLEAANYIEQDITRPPQREGAIAVDSGTVYIGVGGNWVQVS